MATIDKLIRNARQIDMERTVSDTMHATQGELVDAQQEQMLGGKDSEGERIGKYKNKYYRRKKFNMNPLAGYGNVDLRLTGEFYRNIKIFWFSSSFFFESTDEKNDRLVEKYGEDVFGLNKKSRKGYVRDVLTPEGRRSIKAQILKG